MHVKAKSVDKILDVGHEPHGMGDNLSSTLHVRALGAIKYEDQGKRDLEKLVEWAAAEHGRSEFVRFNYEFG
jgi:hypothetical protein